MSSLAQVLSTVPPFDPRPLGVRHPGRVFANLPAAALVEHAVRLGEAALTDLGAITAFTGTRTGRSPKDKFTVRSGASAEQIDWTANQPMDPAAFDRLRDLVSVYLQQRDLYVPSGDVGFWQAALRDPESERHRELGAALASNGRVTVDLLYTDHDGGQPTITRFVLLPDDNGRWRCDVARPWTL